MDNQGKDLISTLPNDVIVSIFSYLKLREAVKTSVLSHRWRNLWTYTTSIFDFGESQCNDIITIKDEEEQKSLEAKQHKFIEWVNLVLHKHKGSTIDFFRVCFPLDEGSSDMINSWIKFALDRHVSKLILDVGCICSAQRRRYSLRTQVLYHASHGSLTEVHLKNVQVDGEALQYLLSNSPKLQVLHVENSRELVTLIIGDPLPNLRRLVLVHCPRLNCLEVHPINIVSLTYHVRESRVFFKEVPNLVEASLGISVLLFHSICRSSSKFSRLESLILDLRSWTRDYLKSVGGFPEFPKFEKLNRLQVCLSGISAKDYVRYCTKLLKASPSLQRFVLKIYEIRGRPMYDGIFKVKTSKYQHKQLEVMEFIGYDGTFDVEFALDLLNKLPSLKKVVIDPKLLYPPNVGRRTILKKSNAQQIQRWLPLGAKLVIDGL